MVFNKTNKIQCSLLEGNRIQCLQHTILNVKDTVQNCSAWEWENMTHSQEKNQLTETNPELTQILELADKDFKTATS